MFRFIKKLFSKKTKKKKELSAQEHYDLAVEAGKRKYAWYFGDQRRERKRAEAQAEMFEHLGEAAKKGHIEAKDALARWLLDRECRHPANEHPLWLRTTDLFGKPDLKEIDRIKRARRKGKAALDRAFDHFQCERETPRDVACRLFTEVAAQASEPALRDDAADMLSRMNQGKTVCSHCRRSEEVEEAIERDKKKEQEKSPQKGFWSSFFRRRRPSCATPASTPASIPMSTFK